MTEAVRAEVRTTVVNADLACIEKEPTETRILSRLWRSLRQHSPSTSSWIASQRSMKPKSCGQSQIPQTKRGVCHERKKKSRRGPVAQTDGATRTIRCLKRHGISTGLGSNIATLPPLSCATCKINTSMQVAHLKAANHK